jgi:hypothetical protein
MLALIVPLLYPDLAGLLNFSDHFRITLGLPTRIVARPVNTSAFVVTNPTDESNRSRLAVIRKQFGG